MHIDRAIRIHGEIIRYEYSATPSDEATAMKMAQSAMTQIKLWREHGYPQYEPLLNGETERPES